MAESSTSASILMKSAGEASKITGLALSTTSVLYITKFLSTAGTGTIEYLPHLFNPNSTVKFYDHMVASNNAGWWAIAYTVVILGVGVVVRKIGTLLSDEQSINAVERFLYGARKINTPSSTQQLN